MAITQTITIFRGEDVQLRFTMTPVEDITGREFALFIEEIEPGGCPAEIAGQVEDGPGGVFTFDLPATMTENWRVGQYQYDVWRTGAGLNEVLSTGRFFVTATARAEGVDC